MSSAPPLARAAWCWGERPEHRDVTILRSLPGIGRINLATLLSEASGPLSRRDYQALRTLSGVAPVTNAAASLMSSSCATPRTFDCATLSIIGHALPLSTMTRAALATPHCVDAGTRTGVLSAASQIDSLQWLASSCNDRLCLTPTSARPPDHKRPFVFDQDNRCFSVRPQGRFSVPTCRTTLRRAQRRSRLAGGHRRSRRNAVLTAASTARTSIRSAAHRSSSGQPRRSGGLSPLNLLPAGLPPRYLFPLPEW